jgi:hypothetical protein
VALLAIGVPVVVWATLNVRGIVDQKTREHPAGSGRTIVCEDAGQILCWFDTYEANESAPARRLGSFIVLLLPATVFTILRGKHETGFGRVVGNIWDVLTFWPRRFHPFAAPCSAERAVPELRERIRYVLRDSTEADRGQLVVVAHSQGTVLAAAAIASLPHDEGEPTLVTFGCPLGTLFAPTWPSYIPPLTAQLAQRVGRRPNYPWVNFWRITDPIGGPVPSADNVHLTEPQAPDVGDFDEIRRRPPRERPLRWGTQGGHSSYLTEDTVRDAIAGRRADRPVPWTK